MKKLIAVWLLLSLLLLSLSACRAKEVTPPTCEQLMEAYETAGFHIFHGTETTSPVVCYVKVWAEDEYDYAFFYFLETDEDAEARAADRQYNVLLYLFSVIYGDPHYWLHAKSYGNIEYEYCNKQLIRPFRDLI